MSVRTKRGVALLLVVIAISTLVYKEAMAAATFYMTVSQLENTRHVDGNRIITVNGNLVGHTITWNETNQILQFSIEDKPGGPTLPIVFHGAKPDDFSNGWPVIVTGQLSSSGTFYANQLLIKCPSKYTSQGSVTYHAKV